MNQSTPNTTQQLRQISVVFRRGELFKIEGLLFEVESADFKRGRLHLRTVDEYEVTPAPAPEPIGAPGSGNHDESLIEILEGKVKAGTDA